MMIVNSLVEISNVRIQYTKCSNIYKMFSYLKKFVGLTDFECKKTLMSRKTVIF